MKVIHVPYCFFPEPVGGTEVYVDALAREQQALGVDALIAAPGPRDSSYLHDGLAVRRFAISPDLRDLRALYGEGDAQASRAFSRLLDEERPDLVHLHALTSGVSLKLAQAVRQRDIPIVFTYHTPTVSCVRGTLLRFGQEVCDGRLDVRACARCSLHRHAAGAFGSLVLSSVPPRLGTRLGQLGLAGGPWTALRMSELVELRHAALRTLLSEVDRIVVPCLWAQDLLQLNGVPTEKLTLSRQGLARRPATPAAPRPQTNGPLRVAYLGRLHPTKGADLLIRAVRELPRAPIELHLFGVNQSADGYERELRTLAGDDARIQFLPPVPNDAVVELLRVGYHALAVPSRILETGPLVVLEAFAAGVPVVGACLGGIRELVRHEVDGLLVEPGSVEAWQQALARLVHDRDLVSRLERGMRPPRGMDTVADEMVSLYTQLAPVTRLVEAVP